MKNKFRTLLGLAALLALPAVTWAAETVAKACSCCCPSCCG